VTDLSVAVLGVMFAIYVLGIPTIAISLPLIVTPMTFVSFAV
jgi:hypothetical protein